MVCVIFPYEWGSESEYDFDKDYLISEVWDPFPYKSYIFLGINEEKLASMGVTVTQIPQPTPNLAARTRNARERTMTQYDTGMQQSTT